MPTATASHTLTAEQVAGYARGAGFPTAQIPTAVAIARAESSFNPRARNYVPCLGLWQINVSGKMGPARRRALGINTNEALYDPAINARAAYMIYKEAGNSWKPWTTYTSGAYKKYLSDAPSGGTPLDADKVKKAVDDAADKANDMPWDTLAKTFDRMSETFRKQSWNWLILLLALVLLTIGFFMIMRRPMARARKVGVKVASKGVL